MGFTGFHPPRQRAHCAHFSSLLSCNFTLRTMFHFHCSTPCRTITALLSSHQTLPIVLGTQLLNFKVLWLPPPSASASPSFVFPHSPFCFAASVQWRKKKKISGCLQTCKKRWHLFTADTQSEAGFFVFLHTGVNVQVKRNLYNQKKKIIGMWNVVTSTMSPPSK